MTGVAIQRILAFTDSGELSASKFLLAIVLYQVIPNDLPVFMGFGSQLMIMSQTALQCCKPLLLQDSLHLSRAVLDPEVLAAVTTALGGA